MRAVDGENEELFALVRAALHPRLQCLRLTRFGLACVTLLEILLREAGAGKPLCPGW